jgi:molybdopterin molybdotransferase
MISLDAALQRILASKADWGTEIGSLEQSLGRVLAEDVFADRDYPPIIRATMDGYAIKVQDFLEKQIKEFRIIGEVFAGDNKNFGIRSGETVKIMTGAAVPDSADAVIKKEDAQEVNGIVRFEIKDVNPLQFIARKGEDLSAGALAVNKHTQIHAGIFSLLAALGKKNVEVMRLPKVAILSVGNEIKPITDSVEDFQIRDSNSFSIKGFLHQYSIAPTENKIVKDDKHSIAAAVEAVMDCDVLISSGGVSVGDADFVPEAMKQCSIQEIFHKVNIKPGKPLWFGAHPNGLRVFALPGNPFSVQVACKIFIEPYLRSQFGLPPVQPLLLPLSDGKKKKTNFDEFFPAKLFTDEQTHVQPLPYNTSGDITALIHAHGIAHHPSSSDDLQKGDAVKFYPWNNFA